jgi:hypothetical protein
MPRDLPIEKTKPFGGITTKPPSFAIDATAKSVADS